MGVVGFTDKGRLGGSRPVCMPVNYVLEPCLPICCSSSSLIRKIKQQVACRCYGPAANADICAPELREKFVNCLEYLCEGDYYRR